MIFKTKRLVLRPWMEKDAKYLYLYAKNPNIGPIAGWSPHQSVDESLYIIKTIFSKNNVFAITLNGKPIGCIQLYVYPDGNYYWGEENGEIGYWVAEPFWRFKIATESCKTILDYAFNDLKLKNVFAIHKKENIKSEGLLKKFGFKYYGEIDKIDFQNKQYTESVKYLKAKDYFNYKGF